MNLILSSLILRRISKLLQENTQLQIEVNHLDQERSRISLRCKELENTLDGYESLAVEKEALNSRLETLTKENEDMSGLSDQINKVKN